MADSRERAVWPPGSHSSQNAGLFECSVKGTCGPTTALCRVLPAVTWYLWKFLDSSLFQTSEAVRSIPDLLLMKCFIKASFWSWNRKGKFPVRCGSVCIFQTRRKLFPVRRTEATFSSNLLQQFSVSYHCRLLELGYYIVDAHKYLCPNRHSSVCLETLKMCTSWWKNEKIWHGHICNLSTQQQKEAKVASSPSTTQMNSTNTILSERSQAQKTVFHLIGLMEQIQSLQPQLSCNSVEQCLSSAWVILTVTLTWFRFPWTVLRCVCLWGHFGVGEG